MHDIAIIMTDRKIKFKPKKVALAKLEHIYNVPNGKHWLIKEVESKILKEFLKYLLLVGQTCDFAGWGTTEPDMDPSVQIDMLSELRSQPIMGRRKCRLMWFFQVRGIPSPSSISYYLEDDETLRTSLESYSSVLKKFEFCLDLGGEKGCKKGFGDVRNLIFFNSNF